MNALVLAIVNRLGFLGKCQEPMHRLRLLRAELVGQSNRATSKVIAVVDNQWRQLQFGQVSGNLEQPVYVGGGGG